MTFRRQELKRAIERDAQRIKRREKEGDTFWRSIRVLGTVGWPIVLLAVGGGLLGQWLDRSWATGVRTTFALVVIGVLVGSAVAWHAVRHT